MDLARFLARNARRFPIFAIVLLTGLAPAMAQNKKNSWEVFLYFGSFYKNEIPSATQTGDIRLYRTEPAFALDPNDLSQVFTPNLGRVGGDQSGDPNYPFVTDEQTQFGSNPPCNGNNAPLDPNGDTRAPYFDECDNDQEERYLYNAQGIPTNGEVQTDDAEYTLGLRAGYNITRHWEVEFDIGFGKQRVNLTRNLIPLLKASINDLSDPRAQVLAEFYEFTWANLEYDDIVPLAVNRRPGEHPNVVASRVAMDPNYNIPIYFPIPQNSDPNTPPPPGETFDDVTGFVNRIFQDPTAFRNRGNQINIDNFTLTGSVNYNFNTKADSRLVPYVSAAYGRWMRNFDSPWKGNDTSFLSYGGGMRFFVNEIFAFRADLRQVKYLEDSFTIRGSLLSFNVPDRESFTTGCERDQRDVRPPCTGNPTPPANHAFPNLGGGGGNANLEIEAELDDFFEVRVGFDVILGGK